MSQKVNRESQTYDEKRFGNGFAFIQRSNCFAILLLVSLESLYFCKKKKKDSNEFYNSYFFLLNYCTKTFEGYEILLHRSILIFLTNLKNAIQEQHLLYKKKINIRKGYLFHWKRTMDATFH